MKKLLALLLAVSMLFGMVAMAEDAVVGTPLVVATDTLSEKFSPYFADTEYDQNVVEMTQLGMMTTDRVGGIIYNAIEGETVNYNGTDYTYTGPANISVVYDEATDITTYTVKIREDLKFSDGEPVTADDIIFTYYVYLDPSYAGSTTLNSYDILGLDAYMTQIPEASLEAVVTVFDALVAAGPEYTVTEADPFTKEQYDAYYGSVKALWTADVQGIVDYVYTNYCTEDYAPAIGKTVDEIGASDGLKVAFGMAMWGFGTVDGTVLTTASGETFDLATDVLPTAEDYYEAAYAKYAGSFDAYLAAGESATGTTTDALNTETMATLASAQGVDMTAGVPNISGIK